MALSIQTLHIIVDERLRCRNSFLFVIRTLILVVVELVVEVVVVQVLCIFGVYGTFQQ